jgi:hypothetical protein
MAVSVTGDFNTSPAYTGYFIPTIWSGKLNVKFYATTVFGEIANTSYEGDIKNMGDKVIINNIPSITIKTYVVGQSLAYEVPAPSKVELIIDKAKYFGVNVSDVLEYQSQPKLMDMFTSDAAKQMAIEIDRDVLLGTFDQCAAANKGATAGVISGAYNLGTDVAPLVLTSSNVLQVFTALASVLDEQNVPDTDRWLVITPYVRNLLMSSNLAQAYITGDSQSILRNGRIGQIDRFTLYVSNLLPSAEAGEDFDTTALDNTDKRTAIMAGHKTAITFASQIAKVESLQNPNDFGTLVRGLNVYGYKVIKPEALALALYATDGTVTT